MEDLQRQRLKKVMGVVVFMLTEHGSKPPLIFAYLSVRDLSRSSEDKLTLHLALVRVLLEYSLVLVSTLQMDIDELEGIQRRATRMLSGKHALL